MVMLFSQVGRQLVKLLVGNVGGQFQNFLPNRLASWSRFGRSSGGLSRLSYLLLFLLPVSEPPDGFGDGFLIGSKATALHSSVQIIFQVFR